MDSKYIKLYPAAAARLRFMHLLDGKTIMKVPYASIHPVKKAEPPSHAGRGLRIEDYPRYAFLISSLSLSLALGPSATMRPVSST